MGTVYRKQTTRSLPVGAELFTKGGQRFARWKAGKRTRTAKVTTGQDGSARIVTEAAMRHSSLELTMNVYTDPRLLDVQGAVESLPEFSVTNEPAENRQRMAAGAENLVAVTVAVAADFSRDSQSTAVTLNAFPSVGDSENSLGCNVVASNEKRSLLTSSSERFTSEAGGTRTRNLRIDSPAGQGSNAQKPQRVAKRRSRRATNGDTNSPENERGEVVGDSVSSRAELLPIKADSFSAALAMIASLPLSDAEKAEAVRRIMAEQVTAQVR